MSSRTTKKVYLYFYDYTEALGGVRHNKVFTQLTYLWTVGKDLLLIKKRTDSGDVS